MKNYIRLFILFLCLTASLGKIKAQCNAAFSYTISANGAVSFAVNSTTVNPAARFLWNYGFYEGIDNAYGLSSTTHTYSANGNYTVNLDIIDSIAGCTASYSVSVLISNLPCIGTIDSTLFLLYENGGTYFTFYGNNLPYNGSIVWTFSNGANYTGYPITPTFTATGLYTNTLTISDQLSICSYSYVNTYSIVVGSCSLTSLFNYSINPVGNVTFASASTGTTSNSSYTWSFGDGTSATGQSASHTYTSNGNYNVSLSVRDSINFRCINVSSQLVNYTPCIANVSYTIVKDSSSIPSIVWDAIPNYPPNISDIEWNWGDGTVTTGTLFPSHTYPGPGNYNICVSVTVTCGASNIYCNNNSIFRTHELTSGYTVNVVNTMTGIHNMGRTNDFLNIYPNPNTGRFMLNITDHNLLNQKANYVITNMLGNVIIQDFIYFDNNLNIEVGSENLSNGVYFLFLENKKLKFSVNK